MKRLLGTLIATTMLLTTIAVHSAYGVSYTVQDKDCLSSIAQQFKISTAAIADANNLQEPYKVKAGMVLEIPSDTANAHISAPPVPLAIKTVLLGNAIHRLASARTTTNYVVQPGDTIWGIARKFHVSWKELTSLNGLDDPEKIKDNMTLIVPANSGAVTVPSNGTQVVAENSQPKQTVTRSINTSWASVDADRVTVREKPVDGKRVALIDRYEKVTITSYQNGWYKVKTGEGTSGWIRGDFLKETNTAPKPVNMASANRRNVIETRRAAASRSTVSAPKTSTTTTNSRSTSRSVAKADAGAVPAANDVIRMAYALRGTRYTWAGTSARSGFDCSGFTQHVWGRAGVSLPHKASQQANYGSSVSRSNLKPGDLIFFQSNGQRIGHVGLYIGNNKFIHASSGAHQVTINSLTGFYDSHFVTARRVRPSKD